MDKKSIDCRNFYTGFPSLNQHHELIPATKWFGLVQGERCILCNSFFIDEYFKFWKKNDY